jgi:hypothetical protein
VYAYYRWLCVEIIRNKVFSNYNHSCFIHIVSFELELTSYMDNLSILCVLFLSLILSLAVSALYVYHFMHHQL